jgi:hypothetical protein
MPTESWRRRRVEVKERTFGYLMAVMGTALATFVVFNNSSGRPASAPIMMMIVGPWIFVLALLTFATRLRGISVGALLMLAYEGLLYYQVFVASDSSTAGLDYMSKWAIQLVFLLPIGIVIGWIATRRRA